MEFDDLEDAWNFLCVSKPESELRQAAAKYLFKNADEAMKKRLIDRFGPKKPPPQVEPAFYGEDGKPYCNYQELTDAMGIPEEDRAFILEALRDMSPVFRKKAPGRPL